jgi:dienelactone hydrolase
LLLGSLVVDGYSRPDPKDAENMVIPYVCLLSPDDGPLETRQAYEKAFDNNKNDTYVETYEDRVHGWMGARCDFKDERAKAEFERGYKKVAEFMNKHLS